MEAFCIFCLTATTHKSEKTQEKNEILSRFFKFLERYLNQNESNARNAKLDELKKEESSFWLLNTFQSGKSSACESCAKLIKSFCDLYHDLKTIQLLLNWQLWTLNNLLRSTGSETSFNGDSDKEKLLQLRAKLLQICSRKLLTSYPKLILQKSPNILGIHPDQNQNEGSPNSRKIKSEFSDRESNNNVTLHSNKSGHFTSKRPKPKPTSKARLSRKILKKSFKLVRKKRSSNSIVHNSGNYIESPEVKCEAETKKDTEHVADLLNTIPPTLIPNVIKIDKEDAEAIQEKFTTPTNIEHNSSVKEARKLRKTHKCTNCHKTFSSEQNLSTHGKLCEDDNDKIEFQSESEVPAPSPLPEEETEATTTPPSSPQPGRYVKKKKNGKFACTFCPKSYNCRWRFREHILSNHPNQSTSTLYGSKLSNNNYRFKCPSSSCKSFFKEIHFLLQHWKDIHSKEANPLGTPQTGSDKLIVEIVTFKGIPESKYFKTLDASVTNPEHFAIIEVSLLKPGMNVNICKVAKCGRPYYSKEDLEVHKKFHGRFTCTICPETREYLPELSDHEVKAHGERSGKGNMYKYNCKRCEKTFIDFAEYTKHHISHFSLDFVEESCPVCKIFYSKKDGSLKFKHMKKAHDLNNLGTSTELYKCKEVDCNAYFINGCTLTYHMKIEHCKKTGGVCEKCGKYFKNNDVMERHRLSHLGPQFWEFCCETCGKKCITKEKLEEHMRTHSNEKPFVCQGCGAKYVHRHNLRIHVNNKHGDVMQDIPQRYRATNLTSRKGVKRKQTGPGIESSIPQKMLKK